MSHVNNETGHPNSSFRKKVERGIPGPEGDNERRRPLPGCPNGERNGCKHDDRGRFTPDLYQQRPLLVCARRSKLIDGEQWKEFGGGAAG